MDSVPSKPPGEPPLPPVQPPTAGFLMQLFLIPMIIVTIIVTVMLAFNWLAHLGADPHDLARDLRILNDASWQKAYTLSNLLRNPQHDELKDDQQLADELAGVLDSQLGAPHAKNPQRVRLRSYLCRALGEFRVPSVSGVLVRAATYEQFAEDLEVRRSAVEALAVLANNVDSPPLRDDPLVMRALLEASRERSSDPEQADRNDLRATAAFALGVMGGDEALGRLESLLLDAYPNVRYNAATGMARHGDTRSIDVVSQMLQADNPEAVATEQERPAQQRKQMEVITSGIQAVRRLAEVNRSADLGPLIDDLRQLEQSDVPKDVQLAAKETRLLLQARRQAAGRS